MYQTNHYGNFTYTVPGFTAGSAHTVTLHFAETYWPGAGQRVFNVILNGSTVLPSFDIVANAGGADKAIVKTFNTTANSAGQIAIQFSTVKDNAQVNGIEVHEGARALRWHGKARLAGWSAVACRGCSSMFSALSCRPPRLLLCRLDSSGMCR